MRFSRSQITSSETSSEPNHNKQALNPRTKSQHRAQKPNQGLNQNTQAQKPHQNQIKIHGLRNPESYYIRTKSQYTSYETSSELKPHQDQITIHELKDPKPNYNTQTPKPHQDQITIHELRNLIRTKSQYNENVLSHYSTRNDCVHLMNYRYY
jgi:hypothetical protein